MAVNRTESTKQSEESSRAGEAPAVAAKGGNPWIPVVANLVLMPVIAYALTTFVLIPKLSGGNAHAEASAEQGGGGHGDANGKSPHPKGRITTPLEGKVLVNVAGTAGTRYLVASMTLVGKTPDFKDNVERNDPQLRDTAASILGSKTLSDVDKPGMRNVIRAELIAAFNDILGKESVQDIYLTEFAVQ